MRTLLVALLLPLFALPACGGADPEDFSNVDTIRAGAQAQVTIERLRKQDTPDWGKIEDQYEVLLPLVKKSDAEWGTDYRKEIAKALEYINDGQDVRVHQQTLAKGLQHVVVLAMEQGLNTGSEEAPARVAAFFEGIRPTFVRRDNDFYAGQPTLEAAADKAIAMLKDQGAGSMAAKRELMDTIHRTYGLCVLYEVMKIERLRDTDLATCAVKLQEAVVFYRVLAPRVLKHDPRAHGAISAMLDASYSAMSAAELETHLNAGLSGIRLR